ncbi:GNAT family N-acetyltransferase [Microbacterium sp. bgisy203]|uniref:GNAT family N-acetyltransferase n=1 Tax=Microbacterium sp. bgisy203 TaxID=3413799 RepID=UPI003D73029C
MGTGVQIRPLAREEIESSGFWPLLWEAAGVDADALMWIRDVELPKLTVIGAVDGSPTGDPAAGPDHADTDPRAALGFAAYEVHPSHIELRYIAVDDAARGRRIGTQLVDATRHADTTLPLLAETDDDAVGFYRALGFDVVPAPRDQRWPERQRYACTLPALGDPVDLTLDTYRTHALDYLARTETRPSPLVDALLSVAVPSAGSAVRVLELGSGPGRDADALEAAGCVVDRTDAAASFLALQHAAGHRARLLDVRAPDFRAAPTDPPYDAVFASAVLLHIDRDELPDVLATARRATRPGGVIAASFQTGDGEEWSLRKLDAPRRFVYWREGPLAAAFVAAGWDAVDVRAASARTSSQQWIMVTAHNPEVA